MVLNPTPDYLRFLTNWSWIGLICYFGSAMVRSLVPRLKPTLTHRILLCCACTIPWAVTLTFWLFLRSIFTSKTETLGQINSFVPHTFNILLMLCEMLVSRETLPAFGFIWPVLAVMLYFGMTLLLRAAFDIPWPYAFLSFLDTSPIWVNVLAVFGMAVALIVFYYLSYILMLLRDWCFPVSQEDEDESRKDILVFSAGSLRK
ncbi:hypothetical protein EDD86DRAFT_199560 [Gorgonomyces haynaldii]|nr:hypothetical protein EDD86DRAFT_199560 [Gorgonomyces haynaldii]